MPEWDDEDDDESGEGKGGTGLAIETRPKVEKPPLYKVLLHNDDFTSMDFVVYILVNVFNKGMMEAENIMLAVHYAGVGVAGVFTYEIAEAKVNKVIALAQEQDFPLLCTIEED